MRRRYTRYKTSDLSGRIPLSIRADVTDISLTGASVRTDHQLKIGKSYIFELGDKGARLKVAASVRWSKFEGTNQDGTKVIYSTGVAFGDITTKKTKEMKRFIEHYADLSPGDRLFGQLFPDGDADGDGPSFGIQVSKISRRKILAEAEMALEPGALCGLVLVLGDQRFESAARVVSVRELSMPGRQARFSLGLEFVDIRPQFAAALDEYIVQEVGRRRPAGVRTDAASAPEAPPEPLPEAVELRGNPKTKVYHVQGCRHFKAKGSSVTFSSYEQAVAAGFRQAKDCS